MQFPDATRPSITPPAARPAAPASTAPPPSAPDRVDAPANAAEFTPSQQQMAKFFKGQCKPVPSPVLWATPATKDTPRGLLPCPDGAVLDVVGQTLTKRDASGAVAWTATLEKPLQPKAASVCVAKDGTVAVTTDDHVLRGLDPASGEERWRLDLGGQFRQPATEGADGSILAFRKIDDQLCLTRLTTDGREKQTVTLGSWDDPIGDAGADAQVINQEPDGRLLLHAPVRFPEPGKTYAPMYNVTWSVLPGGAVESTSRTLDPPAAFAGDPDRYYHADYSSMAAFDRKTGQEIWKMDKPHVGFDPKIGPYGDTLFKLAGDHRYKYVEFFDAAPGRFYLQSYWEKGGHTGEDLLCLDAADPQNALWKRPTHGSVFRGPLYVGNDMILHVSDRDTGTVEAVDPKTGAALWSQALIDPDAGERDLGPADEPGFHRVSRESADNYRVERGRDGTVYVRTYKQVVGLDPATGEVRTRARSNNELGGFALAPDGASVLATDAETGSLLALELETPGLAEQRESDLMAAEARNAPPPPTISVEDEWITIGTVRVPRKD